MGELFAFTVSPLELVVRGSIIYFGLILTIRFLLRRDVGSMSMADVLFVVLIADAAQNGMAGEYRSIADAGVLIGTLVLWNLGLDWLSYRSATIRKLVVPPALPLVRNGRLVRANLRKEWITVEELQSKLREQGIQDLSVIELACLEPSGELGVVRNDGREPSTRGRKRHQPGAA